MPVCRCTKNSHGEALRTEHDLIISLYLLGDSLDDFELRRLATEAMTKLLNATRLPHPGLIAVVWSSTTPRSRFRRLLVENVVARAQRDAFADHITAYPSEFIQEVAVAALRKTPATSWEEAVGDGSKFLELGELKDNPA